jgi:general secretion pathway protein I
MAAAKRSAGFTLIEVLVAFVLLSLVLATGFEIFSTGLRRAGDLEDRSRAIVLAQSKIASAGLDDTLREGAVQGEEGHFHWTLDVRGVADEIAPGQPQPGAGTYMLFRVEARVEWTGADARPRTFSLASMGIGVRP